MRRKTGKRSARNAPRSGWAELFYFIFTLAGLWLLSLLIWGHDFDMRGVEIADYLFGICGGAVFVPLAFFLYSCIFGFLGTGRGNFVAKFLGAVTLFFVTALILGLVPWNAGVVGAAAAGILTGAIGRFFAMVVAAVGLFTAAAFFGIPLVATILVVPLMWIADKISAWRASSASQKKKQNTELQKQRLKQEILESRKKRQNDPIVPTKKRTLSDEMKIELNAAEEAEAEKTAQPAPEPEPVAELKQPEPIMPILDLPEPEKLPAPQPILPQILDGGHEIAPDPELPDEEDNFSIEGLFPPSIEIFGPQLEDVDSSEIQTLAASQGEKIVETLQNFGVKAEVAEIVIGPSVVQFQIRLAPGIRVNKVAGLANDLAMALAVISVRVEAPIPGKPYVGIEIPNVKRKGIPLRSVIESTDYDENRCVLPLPMGMRVDSRFMVVGLEEMPHMLVAGTTGSGKSVFTNTCIMGMCNRRTPDELKLILVDPKRVEFAIYDGLPHLLARPISEPKKAVSALGWAVQEMESRSEQFALAKVRNLESFNQRMIPKNRLPYIVIVVDELADLMYTSGKEVESLIARLAQKARSAGIHLILATQRPSVDVITGLIKANVPARVAFALPSQTDSRTIIDTGGADKLLGKGDMLFLSTRYPRPLRIQASFINEDRTLAFIENLKRSFGAPEYLEFEDYKGDSGKSSDSGGNSGSLTLDPKIEDALNFIMDTGIASASKLQTIMGIGYPRASRIISTLEQLGILGPQPSSPTKAREILMDGDEAFERINEARN